MVYINALNRYYKAELKYFQLTETITRFRNIEESKFERDTLF